MTPTEVRSRLIENGYVPVPCDGKNAKSAHWERCTLETARTEESVCCVLGRVFITNSFPRSANKWLAVEP